MAEPFGQAQNAPRGELLALKPRFQRCPGLQELLRRGRLEGRAEHLIVLIRQRFLEIAGMREVSEPAI